MSDTNKKCNYCNYCDSCDSCYYCNYCNSCDSCDYCNYCNSCYYCNYCDSCDSCYSCYYCNSCYYSVGLRMSERMIFCLGEGRWEKKGEGYQKNNRVFNIQVTPEEFDKITVPKIKLPVTRWIEEKEMTDDEKEDNENYKTLGGYLKTLSYQDAWKLAWSEIDIEVRNQFLAIPHFNKEIFKKITGIEITVVEDLKGKEVEVIVDGKKYKAIIS